MFHVLRRLSSRVDEVLVHLPSRRFWGGMPGILATICLFSLPLFVQADDIYWIGSTGDWSTPSNWSGGVEPVYADGAYVYNGGTVSVTQAGERCTRLFLGDSGEDKSGALQVTGGDLFAKTAVHVGYNGSGDVEQSGGKITCGTTSAILYLGYNAGSAGRYNLGGTGTLTIGMTGSIHDCAEYIGYSGMGDFTQSGGTHTISGKGLYFGYNAGSSGVYCLGGTGTLNCTVSEYIGYSGEGGFTHTAGTHSAKSLYLGYNAGAEGRYEFSGTGILNVNQQEYVGYSGSGTFLQSGGAHKVSNGLYLGYNSGASGSYELNGEGQLNGSITVGWAGTGTFTQTAGTVTGGISLGSLLNSHGTYHLIGNGQLNTASVSVGGTGTGIFNHSAGTNTVSEILNIGTSTGSTGTYNLSGTAQLNLNGTGSNGREFIGNAGTGVFHHTGGTNSLTYDLNLGYAATGNGTYNLSGTGQLNVTASKSQDGWGNVYVGYSGTGVFNHSGGSNTISNSLYLGYKSGSKGTYNLSGTGQLSATNEFIDGRYDENGIAALALFNQSGGINTTNFLFIGKKGQYKFSGGTINAYSLENQGVFDFDDSTAVFNAENGIINFSRGGGILQNTHAATMNIGSNALLIVPAGFDPHAEFAHYSNSGVLHTAGTTLTISSGQTISGWGAIDDPVVCQGTIAAAPGGSISLNNGLQISGAGSIDLGNGSLINNDGVSGISGGSLSADYQTVGYAGTGTFTHSAGNNDIALYLRLGNNVGSNGTYNLCGTGDLFAEQQYIGVAGNGTFNQSGGVNTGGGGVLLGYRSGSSGTYNLEDGQFFGNACIGDSGKGTFNHSGGTVDSGSIILGNNRNTSEGTYNLSGAGELYASHVTVGKAGTGTFNQSGGINIIFGEIDGELRIATQSSSIGTYNLSDGQLVCNKMCITYYGDGTGTFNQSGGTCTINNALAFGAGAGPESTATVNLTGGTMTLKSIKVGSTRITPAPTIHFNIGGGTLRANGDFSITDMDNATYPLPMNLTGVGGNANIDTNGYDVNLTGAISGPGGLNKFGEGTLSLSGAVSYTGGTNIYGGTVVVNSAAAFGGLGTFSIKPGATLSGSGTIDGALDVEGSLSPGNSPGTLLVNNNATFHPGSTFNVQIEGLAAGTEYDRLTTTGAVSLAGTLDLSFSTFEATGQDTLFIIDNIGEEDTTGTFQYADDAKIGVYNGFYWFITYNADNSGAPSLDGGNDVAIYSSTVPEPASGILCGIGFLAFMLVRRMRKWRRFCA